jgi:hypothetical protein
MAAIAKKNAAKEEEAQAALLLDKVSEFRADGVPSTLLTPSVFVSKAVPTPLTMAPTPTGPPNAEALLQAARDGKVEAIRTCLNNHTDIESKDKVCTLFPLSTYIVSSSLYSNSLLHVTIVILVVSVGFYNYINELNSMGCLTAVFIFSLHIFINIYIIKIVMFKYLFIFMLLLSFLLRIL